MIGGSDFFGLYFTTLNGHALHLNLFVEKASRPL